MCNAEVSWHISADVSKQKSIYLNLYMGNLMGKRGLPSLKIKSFRITRVCLHISLWHWFTIILFLATKALPNICIQLFKSAIRAGLS